MGLLRRKRQDSASFDEVFDGLELPSFPHVPSNALELLGDPDVDLREVADIIVADPGVTATILRRVNSVAFGARRSVDSVHQAVGLLSISEMEGMLISAGVRGVLPASSGNGHDPRRFWSAAARRAAIAGVMAARVLPSQRSQVFTAALLQDMAIPFLAAERQGYGQLIESWRDGRADLPTLEYDSFGSDHATLAAQMCAKWDFPPSLSEAIAAHHDHHFEVERPAIVQLVALLRDTDDLEDRDQLVDAAVETLQMPASAVRQLVQDGEQQASTLLSTLM